MKLTARKATEKASTLEGEKGGGAEVSGGLAGLPPVANTNTRWVFLAVCNHFRWLGSRMRDEEKQFSRL